VMRGYREVFAIDAGSAASLGCRPFRVPAGALGQEDERAALAHTGDTAAAAIDAVRAPCRSR
jgi:hypothetical protein